MIEWRQRTGGRHGATVYVHDTAVLALIVWEGTPGNCWAAVSSVGEQHTNEILFDVTCLDFASAKKRAVELAREVVKELAKELGEVKK